MRKRKSSEDQGMDSLMDTLTNVVGILMFVLLVAMLSVNEAVQQIVRAQAGLAKSDVTEQQLKEADESLEKLKEEVEEKTAAESDTREAVNAERLKLLQMQEQVKAEQAAMEQEAKSPVTVKDLEAQAEIKLKELQQLEKEIVKTSEMAESLKAELAEAPELEELPAKVVKLPDPRPAPKEAIQELFFCREGKVIYCDVEMLQALTVKLAQPMIRGQPAGRIDCDVLVRFFEQRKLGNEEFRIVVAVANARPVVTLERKPDAGETLEDLEKPSSDFMRKIRTMNTKRQYCRFIVWPDSFEIYLRARELADEKGVMAGWQPTAYAAEWPIYVPGVSNLLCKDMEPPPPPPPSNAPPPKEGPPKPADVID